MVSIRRRWTFSDPALPPGMTAEKIHAGMSRVGRYERGGAGSTQNCFINPDETCGPDRGRRLADVRLRLCGSRCGVACHASRLALFEAVVVNAIHRAAPQHIALTVARRTPRAAAARWI